MALRLARKGSGSLMLCSPRAPRASLLKRFMSSESEVGTEARAMWEAQLGFGSRISTKLLDNKKVIKEGLDGRGFFVLKDFLGARLCRNMRDEAQDLFRGNRFYPSFSTQGDGTRIEKNNVYAIELDGHEWGIAPSLLTYTRDMMTTAPQLFNTLYPQVRLSARAYATKLAVSTGGGAKYPRHVDNIGLPDTRKLTLVYYMNPEWVEGNGGQMRLFHGHDGDDDAYMDVYPHGDVLLGFWSDELVHEVLPCHDESEQGHRYTQTLWMVTEDEAQIADPEDPRHSARRARHFSSPSTTTDSSTASSSSSPQE